MLLTVNGPRIQSQCPAWYKRAMSKHDNLATFQLIGGILSPIFLFAEPSTDSNLEVDCMSNCVLHAWYTVQFDMSFVLHIFFKLPLVGMIFNETLGQSNGSFCKSCNQIQGKNLKLSILLLQKISRKAPYFVLKVIQP